jgi:hypothetical protein
VSIFEGAVCGSVVFVLGAGHTDSTMTNTKRRTVAINPAMMCGRHRTETIMWENTSCEMLIRYSHDRFGSVSLSVLDEFVFGRLSKRMGKVAVEVCQGNQDVFAGESTRN